VITIEIGGDHLIGCEVFLANHMLRPRLVGITRVFAPHQLISQRPRGRRDIEIAIVIEIHCDRLKGTWKCRNDEAAPGTRLSGGSLVFVPDHLVHLEGDVLGTHPPGQDNIQISIAIEIDCMAVDDSAILVVDHMPGPLVKVTGILEPCQASAMLPGSCGRPFGGER